jgi:chemotaxis protein CheD
MTQHSQELYRLSIIPVELYLAKDPTLISTVLGSCVSVSAFSPTLRIGGLTHAQGPKSGLGGKCIRQCDIPCEESKDPANAAKYVECSTLLPLAKMEELGCDKSEIQVRVIGGADMFGWDKRLVPAVGQRNVETVLELLSARGYDTPAKDIGGNQGRMIYFFYLQVNFGRKNEALTH